MKVILIFPRLNEIRNPYNTTSIISMCLSTFWRLGRSNIVPPLSLLMIAAVTPHNIDIEIIDERFEDIDFNKKVDLVGITVVTKAALRAYQIADNFLKQGITVVLGGIHPSALPQEAILHANAVVIGEGEKVWPQILNDFKKRNLKKFYKSGHILDLNNLPWPRRDIICYPDRYLTLKIILATRGCENDCTFCSNGIAIGKLYRKRSVQEVIKEIESVPGKFVYFADDNLGWDVDYSKCLFESLINLKIKWLGSFNISAFEDLELVNLMIKSGCIAVDIGFESISDEVIRSIKKNRTNDPRCYKEIIKVIHARGIPIFGNFIVGFDNDNKNVFEELINFIKETNIEVPMLNILIPYPGSEIYKQFEKEGRLFHKNWRYYNDTPACVVYKPKNMTAEELMNGYISASKSIYNKYSFLKRIQGAKTFRSIGSLIGLHYTIQKRRNIILGMSEMKNSLMKRGFDDQHVF